MKKIVLAIAIAAFATAATATPAKKKCLAICPPVEEQIEQVEQTSPTWPEEIAPVWVEEIDANPFTVAED